MTIELAFSSNKRKHTQRNPGMTTGICSGLRCTESGLLDEPGLVKLACEIQLPCFTDPYHAFLPGAANLSPSVNTENDLVDVT